MCVIYYVDEEFCVLQMGCSIQVHSCLCMVEVMVPGCVVECKLCSSCYLVWKFIVGADYYVVEFSVTAVGTMRLVIACYCVSGT
jgi:hypothetical protein